MHVETQTLWVEEVLARDKIWEPSCTKNMNEMFGKIYLKTKSALNPENLSTKVEEEENNVIIG